MRELEQTDIQLLRALFQDGRSSFKTLAQQTHTSENITRTHYVEMMKTGIIGGATLQVNFQKLGYTGLGTIMIRVQSHHLAEVCERLRKIAGITVAKYYNSPFNVSAIATLKTLRDFETFKQTISGESKDKVLEFKTQIWTDVRNIPENIFGQEENCEKSIDRAQENNQKSIVPDQADMQIIEALTINGRLPFSKIASQIGMATSTTIRRYQDLKQNNYIKVSIQINPAKLGFQSILEVSMALTDQREINSIVDKISKIQGVSYMVKLSGTYDLIAVFLVKDCIDTLKIIDEIMGIPKIEKMESTLRSLPPLWPGPGQHISTI